MIKNIKNFLRKRKQQKDIEKQGKQNKNHSYLIVILIFVVCLLISGFVVYLNYDTASTYADLTKVIDSDKQRYINNEYDFYTVINNKDQSTFYVESYWAQEALKIKKEYRDNNKVIKEYYRMSLISQKMSFFDESVGYVIVDHIPYIRSSRLMSSILFNNYTELDNESAFDKFLNVFTNQHKIDFDTTQKDDTTIIKKIVSGNKVNSIIDKQLEYVLNTTLNEKDMYEFEITIYRNRIVSIKIKSSEVDYTIQWT